VATEIDKGLRRSQQSQPLTWTVPSARGFQIYFWLILSWGLLRYSFTPFRKSKSLAPGPLNEQGYKILPDGQLEHRYLAEQKLGRQLDSTEIVHHINGDKRDNRTENLCVMNVQKHEHFHAWIRWTKEKKKQYPSPKIQRETLRQDYGGILLSEVNA
jgi:hypothetical protein